MAVKLEIEGFRSLNEQLGEAEDRVRNLVNQFGVGSKEVQQAAQEAGKLKQQMMEADRAIESFTSAGRFDAVAGGIQGIVGGFAAVQGAMAVVGVESEALEQTLLKVQGALALVEGVKGVTEFAKSFSTLKTVAVTAFNGIKAAIGSTGIGLLVVGLGLAVGFLIDKLNDASEAEKANAKEAEDLADANKMLDLSFSRLNTTIQQNTEEELKRAELVGASEAELSAIRETSVLKQIQALDKYMIQSADLYKKEKKNIQESTKSEKEKTDALKKLDDEFLTLRINSTQQRMNLSHQLIMMDLDEQKKAKEIQEKKVADAKKAAEDRKKNELDAAKSLRESLRKFAEEQENDELKNAQLTLANDIERLKEA